MAKTSEAVITGFRNKLKDKTDGFCRRSCQFAKSESKEISL
ncbi:hypothetical protein HMPREF9439_02146 [Parasutterella excrementihominis YIT 11859]|uniref:Uncharacterized protein n=1 Tax=Parasutterella excrementihominis YIT 11859 TaxID=762966 RepID=F3QMH1_9BURK|nr:hypothetical protein HMPREF9439_02146 [Parasutterella excrementihominis YIT 11859]